MLNHWCTGKDSNLRTSLGGTDLQSVGFNHSPTCAKTLGRCGRRAPSRQTAFHIREDYAKPADKTQHKSDFTRKTDFRNTGKPRSRTRHREDSLHAGKVPNGVRWKNLLRRYCQSAACRRFATLAADSFSGAGEGI